MERLKERIAVARHALVSLQEALAIPSPTLLERDAAIQRFEYTVEAIWKAAQRYLDVIQGLSAGSIDIVMGQVNPLFSFEFWVPSFVLDSKPETRNSKQP